jgi:hypothetical protein
MDTPDSPMDEWTMGNATTPTAGSPSIVDALAVSCLCWRMRQSMLDYLIWQKAQLMKQESLLVKYMISFPHNLPDNEDEDIPWHDESPEEYD